MLNKKGKRIIGSVAIFLTASFVIFGLTYGRVLGNLWQKDKQFTTDNNRLFYNITVNDSDITDQSENVTFFQMGSTVYIDYQAFDIYILRDYHPLDYNITRIDGSITLHIIGNVVGKVFCICKYQYQISVYLIFVIDQVDSVEFHAINV